jgi:hypothetical protein
MTPSFRTLAGLFPAFVLLGVTIAAWADDRATVVPRYRLKVGQVLTYRSTSAFKYDGGSLGRSKGSWNLSHGLVVPEACVGRIDRSTQDVSSRPDMLCTFVTLDS